MTTLLWAAILCGVPTADEDPLLKQLHADFVVTLVLLTGHDIPNPYRSVADRIASVRKAVKDLSERW